MFDVEEDSAVSDDDPDRKFVYYDDITGEVKAIVDLYRNPITQQIIIRQIEYVE